MIFYPWLYLKNSRIQIMTNKHPRRFAQPSHGRCYDRSPGAQRALLLDHMPVVGARGRELSELMTDHIFGDKYRHKFFPIMHRKSHADKLRDDHRTATPGLNSAAVAGLFGPAHLLAKAIV